MLNISRPYIDWRSSLSYEAQRSLSEFLFACVADVAGALPPAIAPRLVRSAINRSNLSLNFRRGVLGIWKSVPVVKGGWYSTENNVQLWVWKWYAVLGLLYMQRVVLSLHFRRVFTRSHGENRQKEYLTIIFSFQLWVNCSSLETVVQLFVFRKHPALNRR